MVQAAELHTRGTRGKPEQANKAMEYVNDAYKFGALLCGLHGAGRLAGLSDIAAHVVPQAVAFLILAVLGLSLIHI